MTEPLLQLDQVTRSYALPRQRLWAAPPLVHALHGVSLRMTSGKSLGLVGESGSGKSTLARLVMALESPTTGSVHLLGQELHQLSPAALRAARRNFQMVFQDPYGSLDPRQTVERIVTEPLAALGDTSAFDMRAMAMEVLESVGLRSADLSKYPHEFSGGQRQRVAIARALITRPRLIVADEPVSALDVSVQAQVLNLMQDLAQQFGVTYLLISHDLAVVNHLCEEVAVIYQGRIVEQGSPLTLFRAAAHPYTRALLDAVPRMTPNPTPGQRKRTLMVAPRQHPATACPYAPRCPQAQALCDLQRPELRAVSEGHQVACHFGAAPALLP
nr:ATP-binding cassette domain-containing protein [Rhodoferax sp.]